jgi:RNA polymerase sigma-70 factor (ECF subfamily)
MNHKARFRASHRTGGWESDPDAALMLRVRDGDTDAFHELFARYSRTMVNFVYHFVGNRHRAEELAQDTFLQIYRARRRYEARARFVTYLYRVATNLCLNEVRRMERERKVEPLDGGKDTLRDEDSPTAEERVAGREAADRIRQALEALPANQKAALLLSRVDGLSCKEVADCFETTEGAVKSLVYRATQALRGRLRDLLESPSGLAPALRPPSGDRRGRRRARPGREPRPDEARRYPQHLVVDRPRLPCL